MIKNIVLITGLFLLSACTTTPDKPSQVDPDTPRSGFRPPTVIPAEPPLDVNEVLSKLNIRPENHPLGFKQWAFNPCKIGVSKQRCQNHYLSVVNVQLMCRASEGTTELVTNYELKKMSSSHLQWRIDGQRGQTKTNPSGITRVVAITKGTTRNKRLIFIKGENSLGLRAKEARKIVLPKYWCI